MNQHQFAMQWWMKEEEKRKNRQQANQIHLINNQLSNAIMRLSVDVDKKDYQGFEQEYNRHLVQSGIWHLRYVNNFEDPFVMGVQAAWIALIFEEEEKKGKVQDLRYSEYEFRRVFAQARMHDHSEIQRAINVFPHLKKWL